MTADAPALPSFRCCDVTQSTKQQIRPRVPRHLARRSGKPCSPPACLLTRYRAAILQRNPGRTAVYHVNRRSMARVSQAVRPSAWLCTTPPSHWSDALQPCCWQPPWPARRRKTPHHSQRHRGRLGLRAHHHQVASRRHVASRHRKVRTRGSPRQDLPSRQPQHRWKRRTRIAACTSAIRVRRRPVSWTSTAYSGPDDATQGCRVRTASKAVLWGPSGLPTR